MQGKDRELFAIILCKLLEFGPTGFTLPEGSGESGLSAVAGLAACPVSVPREQHRENSEKARYMQSVPKIRMQKNLSNFFRASNYALVRTIDFLSIAFQSFQSA